MDEAKENPEALQSFIKRLNDKKVRERSLLESNPENARRRLYNSPIHSHTPTYNSMQLKLKLN